MHTVIHIGNHKTGTKILQRYFFPHLRHRKFLGDPFEAGSELEELFERIKYQDFLSYNKEIAFTLYNKIKLSEKLGFENNPVLISDECLATPYLGGKMTADPGIIAHRLKEIFGEVKILYMTRSQLTMLPSLYSQFVSPEYISQKDFEERIEIHMNNQLHGMMHALRFDKICKLYVNLFGKENIKVLPYEMLVNDPISYYKEICDFIDEPYDEEFITKFINIKDHQRQTKGEVIWEKLSLKYEKIRKKFNFGRPSKIFPFLSSNKARNFFVKFIWSKPIELKIPKKLEKSTIDFFGPSNFRLQEMFNLNLSKYGYPITDLKKENCDDLKQLALKGWSVRRY